MIPQDRHPREPHLEYFVIRVSDCVNMMRRGLYLSSDKYFVENLAELDKGFCDL